MQTQPPPGSGRRPAGGNNSTIMPVVSNNSNNTNPSNKLLPTLSASLAGSGGGGGYGVGSGAGAGAALNAGGSGGGGSGANNGSGGSVPSAATIAAIKRRYPKGGDSNASIDSTHRTAHPHAHGVATGSTTHNSAYAYGGSGGGVPQLNFGSLAGSAASAGSTGSSHHPPLAGYNPGISHANKITAPQSARNAPAETSKPVTPARPGGYVTSRHMPGPSGSGAGSSIPAPNGVPSYAAYQPYQPYQPAPTTQSAYHTHYNPHTQHYQPTAGGAATGQPIPLPLPPPYPTQPQSLPPNSGSSTLRHQSRGGGVRPLFYAPAGTGTGTATATAASNPPPTNSSAYEKTNYPPPQQQQHSQYQYQPQQQQQPQSGQSSALPPPQQQQQPQQAPTSLMQHPNSNGSERERERLGTANSSRKSGASNGAPAMTPAIAISKYGAALTPFEQSEILEYSHVYFVGGNAAASKIRGIPHTANNNGYDDERGDYRLTMHDQLEYRYEVLSVLGRGSFGQVVRVMDHKNQMILALKIIRNKKRFHHQALVEVKILEHLMNKDKEHKSNIVRMYGYFYFRNHLCITFEPLSINLYEFIKNNGFKGVSLALIRRFAIQLLVSLKFLRRERIVHCDLKPENVLLKAPNKATIKLIDFGSSCFEDERVYTYIQSRFYRSPEVILGLPYDLAIDMWSFGCILSEMYTGYPLFPGENETEQIQCIMEVLGAPPKRIIQAATRRKTFFDSHDKPRLVPNSRGKVRRPAGKDLQTSTKCTDPNFISFLKKCLKWDPKTRLTPEKALEHPFITEVTFSLAPQLAYKPTDGQPATGAVAATTAAAGTQSQPPQYSYPPTSSHQPQSTAVANGNSSPAAATASGAGGAAASSDDYAAAAAAARKKKRLSMEQAARALFPPVATTGGGGGGGTLPPVGGGSSNRSSGGVPAIDKSKLNPNAIAALSGTSAAAAASSAGVYQPLYTYQPGSTTGGAGASGTAASLPSPSAGGSAVNSGLFPLPSQAIAARARPLAAAGPPATHALGDDDEYDEDDVATAAAAGAGAAAAASGLNAGANSNSSLSLLLNEKAARDARDARDKQLQLQLQQQQQTAAKKRNAEQISKLLQRETGGDAVSYMTAAN